MDRTVKFVFKRYPEDIHRKMLELREIIFSVESSLDKDNKIVETLKWGEPSYTTKDGSTVRIDWKESNPEFIGIYFHCKTKLIDTFKTIWGNSLQFEGNRAILLDVDSAFPIDILQHCIIAALTYHKIKKLPLLGL